MVSSPRVDEVATDKPDIEIIKSSDVQEDLNYEVEMSSLRKMFDKSSSKPPTPSSANETAKQSKVKRRVSVFTIYGFNREI